MQGIVIEFRVNDDIFNVAPLSGGIRVFQNDLSGDDQQRVGLYYIQLLAVKRDEENYLSLILNNTLAALLYK